MIVHSNANDRLVQRDFTFHGLGRLECPVAVWRIPDVSRRISFGPVFGLVEFGDWGVCAVVEDGGGEVH